jgi:hypothetical protein
MVKRRSVGGLRVIGLCVQDRKIRGARRCSLFVRLGGPVCVVL